MRFEPLEDRRLLSLMTFTVNNLSDGPVSGPNQLPGSLRQAIYDANAYHAADQIVFDSSLMGKTITLTAGELDITNTLNLTVTGFNPPNAVTVSGNNASEVFNIASAATVNMSGLRIVRGKLTGAAGSGGGIYNAGTLSLSDCAVSANSAYAGAGIYNVGTATLTDATVSGNMLGGGIFNAGTLTLDHSTVSGNSSQFNGGGIVTYGTLTVTDSTISNNSAFGGGGGICGSGSITVTGSCIAYNSAQTNGGGILNYSSLRMVNSTVCWNTAAGVNNDGGGIDNFGGTAWIFDSTIAYNQAAFGGGVANDYGGPLHGSLTMRNTIVAENINLSQAPDDVYGIVTADYYLIGTLPSPNTVITSTNPHDHTGDPKFDPAGLTDNGGATWTIALSPGSQAINAGANGMIPAGVLTDQRGTPYARISGTAVDIGAFEVQPSPTEMTFTSVPNPSVFGQMVTFTVTVGSLLPTAGIPTGNVTAIVTYPAYTGLPPATLTATLSAGSFSYPTADLPVGSTTINVSYAGNASFGPSSASLVQVVNQDSTTTSLSASPTGSLVYGQSVTFTATVTPDTLPPGPYSFPAMPTGTVSFYADNTIPLGTGTLNASDTTTCTIPLPYLAPGNHTITAVYGGDANFVTSTTTAPESVTEVVGQDQTTTNLASSHNPSKYGDPVTFTATVLPNPPGSGTPTGMVTFEDGSTVIGTGTLSGGVASFSTSTLLPGGHSITAVYGGDTNFVTSTSAPLVQHVQSYSSTTITTVTPVSPSVFGQAVTFTATVAPVSPGTGVPTGMVTFYVGGKPETPVTLSAGIATFTISTMSVGNHTVYAVYGGDDNFAGSTSLPVPYQVIQDSTTTSVSSSANPSVVGQSLMFTATVTANPPGSGTPTGTVTFYVDGTIVTTGLLSGGTATLFIPGGAPGTYLVAAVYSGDTNFTGSTGSLYQVVNQDSTTTIVTSSPNPSTYGAPVTFTANVSANPPGAGTPTGTVSFYADGTTFLGTGTLNPSDIATYTTTALAAGNHTISAVYSGDSNFLTSTGVMTQTEVVNQANLTITALPQWMLYGGSLTQPNLGNVVNYSTTPPLGDVWMCAGWKNGDSAVSLTTLPTVSTSYSAVGRYYSGVNIGGAVDPNYNITYVPGTLYIEPVCNAVYTMPDPLNPGQYILYVWGTWCSDRIMINSGQTPGSVSVSLNCVYRGTFGGADQPLSRIVAHGLSGSDVIWVSPSVTTEAWLYADRGFHDTIRAGGGPTCIVGGLGCGDQLYGGAGPSILIGGAGPAILTAGSGDTILIGGTTAYDAAFPADTSHDAALWDIMDEWSWGGSYATRVGHLLGTLPGGWNGSNLLNAGTVHGNGWRDVLMGSPTGTDLFFASAWDTVGNFRSGETKITV